MRGSQWLKGTVMGLFVCAGVGLIVSGQENIKEGKDQRKTRQIQEEQVPQDMPIQQVEGSISSVEDSEFENATIAIAGDVMPSQYVLDQYQALGITGVLSQELLQELTDADVAIVNEEFPFGVTGEPAPDKQYTFEVDPNYVQIFEDMGIDMVTLANNHALDFGTSALSETFDTLDMAQIKYAGAGDSLEQAMQLKTMQVGAKTIGLLAATRVIPDVSWNIQNQAPGLLATYESTLLDQAIASARENCDYLIVYVHWGIEKSDVPEPYERELAESYIDHGADVVIGSHPHVLQGIDWYMGRPIFYSLGNFIFYQEIEKTMLVKIELDADGTPEFQLVPAAASGACTRILEGEQAQEVLNYIGYLSKDTTIDEQGYIRH